MAEFNFLSSAWGIELTDASKREITEQANSLGRKDVEEYIKDSVLRKLKHNSLLPKELARMSSGTVPTGQYMVQLQKVADITQPTKFQDDFDGGKWRLLALDLAVGDQKFKAIEFDSVKALAVNLPPGTKLLLYSSNKEPLRVQNGHVLLVPNAVQVLGGYVEHLVASWKADKEVKETRLLWRTDGIKKHAEGGAPPWVDFDPKKAPRGSSHRKQFDEERAQWRQGKAAVATSVEKVKDDDGPRFQKEDFGAEAQVKTQVSSTAFAQDQSQKGKGEGKGKKGKGDSQPAASWGRGRNDRDDEEKRAPTQATSSLAAFIKPTKNGELPEAAKLLADGAGDDWGEEWDDNSWGEGWSEGWGQSWGGGYGGQSRKGGSKGGKGKGQRKGGKGGKKGGGKWR